jgi:hypothetical protein
VSPADLRNNPGYTLLAEIRHDDLGDFTNTFYWQKRSWLIWAHYAFSLGVLAAIARVAFLGRYDVDDWLTGFGLGVVGFVLLFPVHEGLHGLAYKLLGAREVRFAFSLRQLYAYALAHRFVADARRFAFVALAPFVVINMALIAAAFAFEPFRFYLLCALLIHTASTGSDFALLNFLWLNRAHGVVTYDDADERKSYFYASPEG